MTEPLAVWMDEAEGWKHVPRESALYEFCAEAAGCDGRAFANTKLPELVLCDGSDLVLWQMGDVRAASRKRDVSLALSIATAAAEVTTQAVLQEREDCAKIADEQRELWHGGGGSEGGGGSAVAATIAVAIRKRGEGDLARFAAELGIEVPETPEHGGGDDTVQGPTDRAGLLAVTRTPERGCPSCGCPLGAAAHMMGDHSVPQAGDITICLNCGHLMAFAEDMTPRELTEAEAYEVAGDERILTVQRARDAIGVHGKLWPPAKPQDDSEPPSPEAPKSD